MVAQQVSTPVSSAAYHCPTELTFIRADDLHNTVTYSAASKSEPGKRHSVSLDLQTGETFCTCRAAECGRRCWHVELVRAAWEGHEASLLASRMNDDQLVKAGRKALRMTLVYRRRGYRVLPTDQATLLACRDVWRKRHPAPTEAAEAIEIATAA
jgi:hypothetical protein